nr:hypothetical protein [uncultured Bacteroides sp.]
MKKEFIFGEVWMLTVSAAFQRANIYKSDYDKDEKKVFKEKLKELIIQKSEEYNYRVISEADHIKNIEDIITFSANYPNVLRGGKLNFGICQKLLNLYLKYLWCLGLLKFAPPHFPVDRKIQIDLGITNPCSWTAMSDKSEYLNVIEIARKALPKHPGINNIAELELKLFKRN